MSYSACATASVSPARRAYSRAIVPARLDSSTTICDPRSNFASSAARCSVVRSSSPNSTVDASDSAIRPIRPARSAIEPSRSSKASFSSSLFMSSSDVSRSARQKNAASS